MYKRQVQGDVEEVAGRVVGVDHKVIVVVRIRKFDAVRGGKFRGEAVGAHVCLLYTSENTCKTRSIVFCTENKQIKQIKGVEPA